MPEIYQFLPEHIEPALELWHSVEHIGLNPDDDHPVKLAQFLNRNAGCSYVALEAGSLVGACLCGHDLRRAAIYHLAVSDHFRRTGLGHELVTASLSALSDIGITRCHAFVFRENPYANRFWEPEGWLLRNDLLMFSKTTMMDR